MNALAKLRAFGLILAVACVAVSGCQGGTKTEGASSSTAVEMVAFEVGDFVHAIVKDDKGTETSYYIGEYPIEYFLAAHIGKKVEIETKTSKEFLEEANQEVEMTKIMKASSGGVDATAWWKKELESASEEELQKKYNALIEEHNRAKMPDPDPVALSLGGWVFAVNQGGNWSEPGKDLDGKEMSFASVDGSQAVASLEYSDGPPVPSVSLKGDVAKGLFQVSGSRATFLPGKRIAAGDAAAAKVAQDFAKSKGKTGKAQIVDGLEADLDGDGKPEQVLAISSGSTLETKKAADFYAVIVRTQDKTLEVVYESEFGEMRGPLHRSDRRGRRCGRRRDQRDRRHLGGPVGRHGVRLPTRRGTGAEGDPLGRPGRVALALEGEARRASPSFFADPSARRIRG